MLQSSELLNRQLTLLPGLLLEQLPFKLPSSVLAWAVTIHKLQGITLGKAVVNLGSDIFDHGQLMLHWAGSGGWSMSCWLACLERPLTRTRAVCMMNMHAWLDVLLLDGCILASRQRLCLVLLCVLMCLYNHCVQQFNSYCGMSLRTKQHVCCLQLFVKLWSVFAKRRRACSRYLFGLPWALSDDITSCMGTP